MLRSIELDSFDLLPQLLMSVVDRDLPIRIRLPELVE